MVDNESVEATLRRQIMVSQFQMATGCNRDQAEQLLRSSCWQFQIALSTFFQESVPTLVVSASRNSSACLPSVDTVSDLRACGNNFNQPSLQAYAPQNTPVTPPSLCEALTALQKLHSDEWNGGSSPSAPFVSPSTSEVAVSSFMTMPQSSSKRTPCWPPMHLGAGQTITGGGGKPPAAGSRVTHF